MGRKKKIVEESISLEQKLKDLQAELEAIKQAEVAETNRIENVINTEISDKYFCGIVLDIDDVTTILKLMFDSKETVRIPYKLYLNKEE